MDWPLRIGFEFGLCNNGPFHIDFNDIFFGHSLRCISTGHEKSFRVLRVSHSNMTHGIEYTLICQDPVRPDELIDCLLGGFRVGNVGAALAKTVASTKKGE